MIHNSGSILCTVIERDLSQHSALVNTGLTSALLWYTGILVYWYTCMLVHRFILLYWIDL